MKEHILQYLNKFEEKKIYFDKLDDSLVFTFNNSYYKTKFEVEDMKTFYINNSLRFEIQSDDNNKLFCHVIFYQNFKLLFDCFLSSQNTTILLQKFTHSKKIG